MSFYLRLILVMMMFPAYLNATHIVGGEMNYRYLGNNLYEIQLTVYRDCYNGVADFDNPASIGIFDSNNNLYSSTSVFITSQQPVTHVINTPCLVPPTNVCYEVAYYIFTTALPPRPGGYQIAYQRCCRNGSIINLVNVNNTGATYVALVPDSSLAIGNSNPVFKTWPPTFICKDAPFRFDHSATDADGDSLVYELSVPLNGADQFDPMPVPPNAPPYSPVTYLPPYSLSNVFGGVPLTIDPFTGEITATPNTQGQFVYGVTIKEYRNGVLLGETRRDFQVNVVSCPQITVASIFSPTIVCGSLSAEFVNNSYNAAYYKWDFGDPATIADTSTLQDPSYLYPDTGNYTATLIAYSAIDPGCNDTATGLVHVYPVFNAAFTYNNNHCTPDFGFIDQSYGIGGTTNYWFWNFGDGNFSSDPNPSHSFAAPGTYDVTLISSTDPSCYDTLSMPVYVLEIPVADFSVTLDTCRQSVALIDSSFGADFYSWSFGDNEYSYDSNPVHEYKDDGTFSINLLVATDSLCMDSVSMIVEVPPLPLPDFSEAHGQCDSVVSFTNHSNNAVAYVWNFGDGDTSESFNPVHTYSIAGDIDVELTAESFHGCTSSVTRQLHLISYKEARFSYQADSCSGLIHFNNVTENAVQYLWDFGDGTYSTEKTPVHKYPEDKDYEVLLTVNGETVCVDTVTGLTTFESPLGERLFVPNSFTPNGDGKNELFRISVFRPCEVYELDIINRWGEVIFQTDDASLAAWDGTFNGEPVMEGAYVYLLRGAGLKRTGVIYVVR